MNTTLLKPVEFFISAVSPIPQPPESESYEIKTKLNNGGWINPMGATGIHEVRGFLHGKASEEVIIEAIKNLRVHRQAHIKAA